MSGVKAPLVLLAGVVAGGLVMRFLDRTSVDEARSVAPPRTNGADVPLLGEVTRPRGDQRMVLGRAVPFPATAEQPGSVQSELQQRTFEELSAELERLVDAGGKPGNKAGPLLKELAHLEDPRGLELVLQCMREGCLGRGSAYYAKALKGVRDARIVDAATEALEANLAVGRGWPSTMGYFGVIAAQGGEAAAAVLLRHLDPEGSRRSEAARAVAGLHEPDLARPFLERLRTADRFTVEKLAKSLASWGDPGVIAELFDLGFGGDLEPERRGPLLSGIADGLPSEFAAEFVARAEALFDTAARAEALSALGNLGDGVLGTTAMPMILAGLSSGDPGLSWAALSLVGDHEVLHTAQVESLLATWLPTISDPGLREEVTRTLAQIRNP